MIEVGWDHHRRVERLLKRATPSLLLVISLLLSPSSGRAEVSSSNQNESAAAFQAVDNLARLTRGQGDLPRWSNPGHAKILARFWDTEATLGRPPHNSADLPALLDIADRAGALYKAYLLYTADPTVLPDTAANTFEYQDEIARAAAYLLRVQGAELEAITHFVGELPAGEMTGPRRAGLLQMRLGISEMVTGMVLMLRSPNLRTENRGILLNALAENASTIATATPLADRMALIAQIDTVLPFLTDNELEKALAIKSALQIKECHGLCAVKG